MAHKVKCISYLIQSFLLSSLSDTNITLALITFSLQPNFAFLTTNLLPLNSDWITPDRCHVTAMSDAGGTEQGWEVNIFDDDPIPLLRQELKEFDALIGGC